MCCTKKLKILHKVVRCHSTGVTQNNFFMREKLGPKIPFLVFQQYLLNESTYKLRFLRMTYQILSAIKWHQSCAESVNQSFNNKKRMYRENTKFPKITKIYILASQIVFVHKKLDSFICQTYHISHSTRQSVVKLKTREVSSS